MSTQNKYILAIVIFIIIIILAAIFLAASNLNRYNSTQMDMLISDSSDSLSGNKALTNLYNQGNFSDLNKELDSQLLKSPNDFALLLQKAQALAQEASLTFKEKELGDQALIYIDKALAIDPESAEALTVKGYIYEIQQDYIKAHKYYDAALKFDPSNIKALAQKAHAYDLQGELDKSEVLYKKAIAIMGNNIETDILLKYSRVLQMKNQKEEAYNLLLKNINKINNNRVKAEAYFMLGQYLQKTEYNKESESYFTKAIESDKTFPMAYVGLAQESFKQSFNTSLSQIERNAFVEKSLENLSTALKLNPNQSFASLELAKQMSALGNDKMTKAILTRLKTDIDKDITLSFGDKELLKEIVTSLLKNIK